MTAPRTYDVGDRVTIVGGPKLRADTGVVVEVKQDPLPYRVDFGAPWTPAWWSGLELEPAAEAAPPSKAKADGDFATVEEHIAAWKAGGRRWAKVEGFNVDAWQAERDALVRADAVIGEATPAEDLAVAYCAKVEAARGSGLREALKPAVMAYTANRTDHDACPTCGAVKGER